MHNDSFSIITIPCTFYKLYDGGEVGGHVTIVTKYLWISTIFLDRHLHCCTMEKSMGYGFVPECNHAQEIHTSHVSFFVAFAIFAGPRFVEKFCYHGNAVS